MKKELYQTTDNTLKNADSLTEEEREEILACLDPDETGLRRLITALLMGQFGEKFESGSVGQSPTRMR